MEFITAEAIEKIALVELYVDFNNERKMGLVLVGLVLMRKRVFHLPPRRQQKHTDCICIVILYIYEHKMKNCLIYVMRT